MKKSDLEAILFLSKEIVDIHELASFFNLNYDNMIKEIKELQEEYKDRGINIQIEEDRVFLRTNPHNGETIKNYFTPELKLRKLSKSSLEVLAIIAYKGPITRKEIEKLRGVGVDHIMPILLEKKLIYSSGKQKSLGNPSLYEVTEEFYAYLGIKGKEELFNFEKSNWLRQDKDLEEGQVEDENK